VLFDGQNRPIDYRFLEVNPAFEAQTGLHDAQGKRMKELAPDHEAHWFELYGQVALTGEPAHFTNQAKALNRWYDVRAYRVGDPASHKVAIIFSDITERQKAMENLRQAAAELARSNRELEQFAYVASHDLQEPLRGVIGFANLLKERYQGKLDARANEYIGFAVEGATRMNALILDLLSYSRVGAKGQTLAPTDLEAPLFRALANLKVSIEESGAEVTRDELPTVAVDPGQITQLFQNLIGNAIKFHGDRKPVIHVGAEKKDGQWQIAVRDNGIGLDMKHQERIFQIFQRLHARDAYPGTGIGLAICKKIVEGHGGRIWVESQPGQGTTFYFTLSEGKGGGGRKIIY
jgi:PAS domain S-box-containing protein